MVCRCGDAGDLHAGDGHLFAVGNGADRAGHGLHRIVQPRLRIARIVFPGADDADRALAPTSTGAPLACWSRAMPPT